MEFQKHMSVSEAICWEYVMETDAWFADMVRIFCEWKEIIKYAQKNLCKFRKV